MADKEKKDSIEFVKGKCDEGEDWAIKRQVQINRAFYSGQQWISWDRVQRRVYVPDMRPGEKRYTYNKIKPAVLTLLAKLCKNRVKLEVRPDTNDIDRIEVAKAGIKYLHYQWQDDDMDRKTRRLRMHMLIDGFPALKVYVDKTKGNDLEHAEMDEDELKEIGVASADDLPTKSGKICTQVCDQFAIKVDPSAEDVTEIRWAVEERPTDINVIKDVWGVEVEAEDNISMMQTNDSTLSLSNTKKYKNMAMVKDYWEKPCPEYPNGRRIVVAAEKELLNDDKDPGEFPFIFFPAIPVPGRAISDGVVTDLTTPQRSYNIKRTAEARILEEMGNPMWMVPTQSVPDMDDLSNEIGGFVEYTPINGGKPERVQGATVDQGWQNAMERDEADMEDISGAHEISQGSSQKGNDTLGGLQLQVEQDETKLALLVQSYEDGMKDWGQKVLRLIQKYFPEEQQLNIVGETGEIESFYFSGADLTGGEMVDVVPGSSMPTLKAAQDQKIMGMYSAGMFNDPQTGIPNAQKVIRMLGESIAAEYFDDSEQDRNKALTENRTYMNVFKDPDTAQALAQYTQQIQAFQMKAQEMQANGLDPAMLGLAPPQPPIALPKVRDFYDHQIHIEEHNRYRKSDEYDELPPELQMLVDTHVQEHIQALQAPMIAEQQQQQVMAQQQGQAQQEQMNAQSQEAEAQRQHQLEMKSREHQSKMQQEQLKGENALLQASVRGGKT